MGIKQCKHTKKPDGYLQQIEWRIEMSRKGYVQHQCKTCGAWAIWKKDGFLAGRANKMSKKGGGSHYGIKNKANIA